MSTACPSPSTLRVLSRRHPVLGLSLILAILGPSWKANKNPCRPPLLPVPSAVQSSLKPRSLSRCSYYRPQKGDAKKEALRIARLEDRQTRVLEAGQSWAPRFIKSSWEMDPVARTAKISSVEGHALPSPTTTNVPPVAKRTSRVGTRSRAPILSVSTATFNISLTTRTPCRSGVVRAAGMAAS